MDQEMLNIMEGQQDDSPHDLSNASFHSSSSRFHAFELNDMGYGLNRISPITFDENAFQTANNRTQGRAPTSTPRKQGKKSGSQEDQQRQDGQVSSESYNTDTSVRNVGQFIPPGQSNPSDISPSSSEDVTNQTVFQGNTQQRSVSTSTSMSQQSNTTSAHTGTTGAMHTGRWYTNFSTSTT